MKLLIIFGLLLVSRTELAYSVAVAARTSALLVGRATVGTGTSSMKVSSKLRSDMLFTSPANGFIGYGLFEHFAYVPGSWKKLFLIKMIQREDGGYDLIRGINPDGDLDGNTQVDGSFVRNDDNHTAILEFHDPDTGRWVQIDGGLWVKLEFANTRTSPPETEADKESWRLKITTTIKHEDTVTLSAEDELKWIEDEIRWMDSLNRY